MEEHVLILRRQILRALEQVYPAVAETEELVLVAPLLPYEGAGEELRRELLAMQAWGLVENLQGGLCRRPWWRITAAGLEQIRREAAQLDRRVWGKLAL